MSETSAQSRYPEIKGLEYEAFKGQLAYLKRHYTFVTMEEVIDSRAAGETLPNNAVLLTFDDAYRDHYTHVFPLLDQMGIQGSFYAPARVIHEKKVLDVNKIHFILASCENKNRLVQDIRRAVDQYREEYGLDSNEAYWEQYARPNRFDPAEVIFIKRMLQAALPEELRGRISDDLFKTHVSVDEAAFSEELYMSKEQMQCMIRHGMHFGSHSWDHYWLNTLTPQQQAEQIDGSLRFLDELGINRDYWTICYPYGGYNESLLTLLRQKKCRLGFTSRVDLADPATTDPLLTPRLDTNDLPKEALAPPGDWTQKIL